MRKYRKTFSAKYLRSILHYDPDTGSWTWIKSIHRNCIIGAPAGHQDKSGYHHIGIHRLQYVSSRLAWLYMKGRWPKKHIDHKDGKPSNGKWNNLRPATHAQNMWNRRKGKNLKGAYKEGKKFRAIIGYKNKTISLGTFATEEMAHAAYMQAAKKLYREFARAR